MVVVMIVGLMYYVSFTAIDFLNPHYRLRGAARQVAAQFKIARSTAAAAGVDCWIRYEPGPPAGLTLFVPQEPLLEDGQEAPPAPDPSYPSGGSFGAFGSDPASAVTPPKLELEPYGPRQTFAEDVEFATVYIGSQREARTGTVLIRVSPFGLSANHIVNLKNADDERIGIKLNGLTGHVSFNDEFMEPQPLEEDR